MHLRGYRGLQEVTRGDTGLLAISGGGLKRGYSRLKKVTRGYRALQGVTRGYWGLQKVTRG